MPGRRIPFVTGQTYHVYNRGIDRRATFTDKREYERAKIACDFYRFAYPGVSLSRFVELSSQRQAEIRESALKSGLLVDIFAYCLMPNHFHFLLRQNIEGGVSKFLSNFQNSHTRFFNLRNKRQGSLFLTQCKGVRIEDEDQLMHVNRYIHLNPHTSYLVKSINKLKEYPWSSLNEYLYPTDKDFCNIDEILEIFKSPAEYWKFISDQAGYQRELKRIEHLTFES